MNDTLFDKEFLGRLEHLALSTRQRAGGKFDGQRRSAKRGTSVEFADFKAYAPGDDFRHVDWNAYARMDRLFLKLFMEEQDTCIHLLVDCSESMAWEDGTKLRLARQLAAALGYLGLVNFDRVAAAEFGRDLRYLPPLRGRGSARRLFSFLAQDTVGGKADLLPVIKELDNRLRNSGIVVLISDLLMPDAERSLAHLGALRIETAVIHILHPQELSPRMAGEVELVDCENDAACELTLSEGVLRQYQQRLAQWQNEINQLCSKYGINYVSASSDEPLDRLVLEKLRRLGLLE